MSDTEKEYCKNECCNYEPIKIDDSLLFTPSEFDKKTDLGGREKIPVYFFVDPQEPSILYIKTYDKAEVIDNSKYILTIPQIEFNDGEIVKNHKEEFVTSPSPAYVKIDDVLSLCKSIPIERSSIAYFIREASKIADYYAYQEKNSLDEQNLQKIFDEENIRQDYYPFYMFVKYKAVVECIKEFYITVISRPSEFHDVLSDLEREEKMDLDAIKDFLDYLDEEAKNWLEIVVTITADPKWALRGKYSYAITNYNYKPYHPTLINRTNWDRGY